MIDKLHNTLNTLMINRNVWSVETIKSIEITIKTLKTIEDCDNYKDKEVRGNSFGEFHKLINEIGKKYDLDRNLFEIKKYYVKVAKGRKSENQPINVGMKKQPNFFMNAD